MPPALSGFIVALLFVALGGSGWSCAKAKVGSLRRMPGGLVSSRPTPTGAVPFSSDAIGVSASMPNRECPQKLVVSGPLPNVLPHHRDPEFWLSRLAQPDSLVLAPPSVAALNGKLEKLEDIANAPDALLSLTPAEPSMAKQLAALSDTRRGFRSSGLVTLPGALPADELFRCVQSVMEAYISSSQPRLIHDVTPLRCLPTDDGLFEVPVDAAFDLLLCSTLRPGEVVREISRHEGGWSLVRTAYSSGWLHTDALSAPVSEEDVSAYLRSKAFVVVTQDQVPISRARDGTAPFVRVKRGLRLPLLEAGRCHGHRCYRTRAPTRSGFASGWIRAEDVHVGYLPLTQRQLLKQAFAMLDQPYGWGGLGGNRDCSQYLMDLFAMFGLNLPRNSAAQSLAGSETIDITASIRVGTIEALERVLSASPPRVALLYLPGHIMLLLGKDDGDYYAIHQFSGYRVGCAPGHDVKMAVDRVSVTPLRLGQGSERGSLRDRLTRIVVFGGSPGEVATARGAE